MIVVGGVTRLTHSGLSITEWQPMVGTLPPMSTEQWDETFRKYQATPEYQQVNRGMSLEAFKAIFWWEYFHRLLGRAIGVVFAVPLLWFLIRRQVPRGLALGLAGIFLLGGLQGALGWYMVQSGLVDDPRVSHLRLSAHLGLALLIFAAMLWVALSLLKTRRDVVPGGEGLFRFGVTIAALVFVQALAGGLVAGTHAGLAYNTFPSMNGYLLPPEIMQIEPWYLNPLNNMATVQFDHRLIAWVLALLVPIFWWRVRRPGAPSIRSDAGVRQGPGLAANLLLAMLIVQIALGIATLLLRVPVPLAAAHQAGAVLLFAAALNAAHSLRWRSRSAPSVNVTP